MSTMEYENENGRYDGMSLKRFANISFQVANFLSSTFIIPSGEWIFTDDAKMNHATNVIVAPHPVQRSVMMTIHRSVMTTIVEDGIELRHPTDV